MSGLLSLGQLFFYNYYFKPKIEAEVKAEVGDLKIERKRKSPAKTVQNAVEVSEDDESVNRNRNRNRNNRNAGKQQRNN